LSDTFPLASAELLQRLQAVYVAHMLAGWETVQAVDQNTYGLDILRLGAAVACRSRQLTDVPPFNRAFGLGSLQGVQLDELLAFCRDEGLTWQADLLPGELTPGLARHLAARGLYQVDFTAMLYGPPTLDFGGPARVAVEEVDPRQPERFIGLWAEGMSHPVAWRTDLVGLWRHWFQMPGYRLYVAHYDGLPAAIAGLWCHDGVAEMHAASTMLEYRGKGCQLALLRQRIADAAGAGCELISAQAVFASAGMRNLERAGLRIACTKAIWRDGPVG
jgi:GNAT superfamily N-acetyltransferase